MATTQRFEEATYAPKPVADGDPFLYDPFVPGQEDEAVLLAGRQADRASAVREAISKLPDRQRQYMLWTLDGLSQADIARKVGVSEAAVSQRLAAAREALAEDLAYLI